MQPGQRLTRWWQDYVAGFLRTPQQIVQAAHAENPDPPSRFVSIPELPEGAWNVPKRLAAPNFLGSTGYLSQMERADWAEVDERLKYWAALFVEYARKRGIPLYVHAARRGRAEQDKLKAQGRSRAAYGKSAHNIGEAVDIVHGLFHWDLLPQEWQMLHVLGRLALDRVNAQLPKDRKLELTWGGTFKSIYDPAHWEITDFRQRASKIAHMGHAPPLRQTPRAILNAGRLNGLK